MVGLIFFELYAPAIIVGIILLIVVSICILFAHGYSLRCRSCGQPWAMTEDERTALVLYSAKIKGKAEIKIRCKHYGCEWIAEYGSNAVQNPLFCLF